MNKVATGTRRSVEDSPRILHVGRPNVGDRAKFDELVNDIFERRWFSNNGKIVQQLESVLSEYLGVKHCILVCNATVGLQIACHALDLSGEVILPAYTFVATAHALQWERLTPVFADIDSRTHNICPQSVEDRITDRTSAILGVHVWGRPCDTDSLCAIADRYGLVSLFDAAHALGCKHQGRMIGNFGKCEVFSFHATKFFNTFEGGAIVTNDDDLAQRVRLMKNFGFSGRDNVAHLGTNGKMPEICAAMGLACFEKLDQILTANRSNYELYREQLESVRGVEMVNYDHLETTNWQYVIVEIDEAFPLTRDHLMHRLHEHGVLARRYFYPGCHRMEPYATEYPRQSERLPHTDKLCSRVLCLPNGTSITSEDVRRVCDVISDVRIDSEP